MEMFTLFYHIISRLDEKIFARWLEPKTPTGNNFTLYTPFPSDYPSATDFWLIWYECHNSETVMLYPLCVILCWLCLCKMKKLHPANIVTESHISKINRSKYFISTWILGIKFYRPWSKYRVIFTLFRPWSCILVDPVQRNLPVHIAHIYVHKNWVTVTYFQTLWSFC